MPQKQPKRGRSWLNDGSVIRLRPLFRNHVWSYDFNARRLRRKLRAFAEGKSQDRTHNGVKFRLLNVIDEYTCESLAIRVARRMSHRDVIAPLFELFLEHDVPEHICSDNGFEFTVKRIRRWLSNVRVKPLYIEPGSPWENGYIESFNGKLRDELLDREILHD